MRGGYPFSLLPLWGFLSNTTETCISWKNFTKLFVDLKNTAKKTAESVSPGCSFLITCRFTHIYPSGPAPYFSMLLIPKNRTISQISENISIWLTIKKNVMDVIMSRGATSTHHHSVGRLHLPYVEIEQSELFKKSLIAIKKVHDPKFICNPGVFVNAKL